MVQVLGVLPECKWESHRGPCALGKGAPCEWRTGGNHVSCAVMLGPGRFLAQNFPVGIPLDKKIILRSGDRGTKHACGKIAIPIAEYRVDEGLNAARKRASDTMAPLNNRTQLSTYPVGIRNSHS